LSDHLRLLGVRPGNEVGSNYLAGVLENRIDRAATGSARFSCLNQVQQASAGQLHGIRRRGCRTRRSGLQLLGSLLKSRRIAELVAQVPQRAEYLELLKQPVGMEVVQL